MTALRVALVAVLVACGGGAPLRRGGEDAAIVRTSSFGTVAVRGAAAPRAIVLLVGAEPAEVPADAVAVPLGYDGWLRREAYGERCWFVAGQLLTTADEVRRALGLGAEVPVWVVGQGVAGGPVAVLTALQAPPGAFAGVVTVGFAPSLAGGRSPCGVDPATWTRDDGAPPAAPLWVVRPRPGGVGWVQDKPWARQAPAVALSSWWREGAAR